MSRLGWHKELTTRILEINTCIFGQNADFIFLYDFSCIYCGLKNRFGANFNKVNSVDFAQALGLQPTP